MSALTLAFAAAADELDASSDELTRLDSLQGDGDLGRTAKLIAAALREAARNDPDDPVAVLRAAGTTIASVAPSSSGTLIAGGFLSAATAVGQEPPGAIIVGLRAGIDAIRRRGKAEAGERTMLDALVPALLRLEADQTDYAGAASAAERGSDATRDMTAKFGRARFLARNAVGEPDPGAVMVSRALAAALRSH